VLRGLSMWSLLCAYLSTITAGASSHYIVDGCSGSTCGGGGDNGKPVECASDDATKGSTMGDTDTDNIAVQCCAINGPSADRVGCKKGVSFDVAEAYCEENGHRLCTKDEVLTDIGKMTGCGFNDDHVWTSTPCSLPTVFDPSPSPTRSPSPEPTSSPNQPMAPPTAAPTTAPTRTATTNSTYNCRWISFNTATTGSSNITTTNTTGSFTTTDSNATTTNTTGSFTTTGSSRRRTMADDVTQSRWVCSFSCDETGSFAFYDSDDCTRGNGTVVFATRIIPDTFFLDTFCWGNNPCSNDVSVDTKWWSVSDSNSSAYMAMGRAVDEELHDPSFDTFESDEEATDSDSNLLAVLAASSAFVAVVCISVTLLYALRRKHSGEEAKVADEMIVEEDVPDHTDVSVEMITETPITM